MILRTPEVEIDWPLKDDNLAQGSERGLPCTGEARQSCQSVGGLARE